ncbi:hypothetical protein AAF712_015050 [Marasmius tenuissimus]|uniref:Uncharacterized protein n=1 Tax=Marasmius tenuissimus TaxID=585030 RepID=A0ABR2ZAN0_9AGAR
MSWAVLVFLNVFFVLSRRRSIKMVKSTLEYSFVGDDYPIELPIVHNLDFVTMRIQDSSHYALNKSDQVAGFEWDTLTTNPLGFGRVKMGPKRRLLTATFFHQMHCIREMAHAAMDHNDRWATRGHVAHCLSYLRQSLLCDADYKLELGNFMDGGFEAGGEGEARVCRDWETVFRHMGQLIEEDYGNK